MKKSSILSDKGFTMVELLVVAGMMTVVMTAMYSVYRTQQRSTYVQEDVVEVQQNLRIAMDSITKDIRMAGLLMQRTPYTSKMLPIESLQTSNNTGMGKTLANVTGLPIPAASDNLVLQSISSSASLAMAWIDLSKAVSKGEQTGVATPFIVDSIDSVDRFSKGDLVKVIRPEYMVDPVAQTRIYKVTAKSPAGPSLTLEQLPGAPGGPSAANYTFFSGDLIVKIPTTYLNPCTIRYFITDHVGAATCPTGLMCLAKTENEDPTTTTVVATNITNLQLSYIKGGVANLQGSNDHLPTGPGTTDEVRSVKVTVTGLTSASVRMSDNNMAKERTLTSIVKFNNKK